MRGKGRDQPEWTPSNRDPLRTSSVSVPLRGKGRDQRGSPDGGAAGRRRVSVPLRGKGRDQRGIADIEERQRRGQFPSPCGEKVGINQAPQPRTGSNAWCQFPSPCGEKVGINGWLAWGRFKFWRIWLFPSPCGEKVGINGFPGRILSSCTPRFPSPCGEKVGINLSFPLPPQLGGDLFPSPCGEKVGINLPHSFPWRPW